MSTEVQARLAPRTSRVGKLPVAVPKGVTVTIQGCKVLVQGAKGKLELDLPANTSAELKDARALWRLKAR